MQTWSIAFANICQLATLWFVGVRTYLVRHAQAPKYPDEKVERGQFVKTEEEADIVFSFEH